MSFKQPKYKVGDRVKVKGDRDALAGHVLDIYYDGQRGWSYKISSRYFDEEINNIVEGHKTCNEDEIEVAPTKEENHE